jgi:hypothetical protein
MRGVQDGGRARHDPGQLLLGIEVQVVEDAEALAKRRRQHARPRRRRHQRERTQRVLQRARVHALVDDEVDREVLHGRIEQLLHRPRQPVDLVDEHHVVLAEIGQDPHQVRAALDGRTRRRRQIRPHLVGEDPCQRGFAEARRTVEEHVVDALPALAGGRHRDAQARDRLVLADVLVEGPRAQRALELGLLRGRHAAEHPPVLRHRHPHVLAFAAACPR